ncbi:MAG: hypothetical protein EXR71_18970 [Myxococcales bacterium]|nr:hypothetical protein [Myxococcales bacterium]
MRVQTHGRVEAAGDEGAECRWEEEALWVGATRVIGGEPPDAADWCAAPSDHWSTLDILGQDGRFVSVLTETDLDATACRTWDVEAGRSVSLTDYDEKASDKRLKRAVRLLRRRAWTYPLDADAFYVGGGHIVFCLFDDAGTRHDLPVP